MVDPVSTELSLSDAGWAGALACGGLLIALRLLRDALHQRQCAKNRRTGRRCDYLVIAKGLLARIGL